MKKELKAIHIVKALNKHDSEKGDDSANISGNTCHSLFLFQSHLIHLAGLLHVISD